jgi:hypothetical protein
MIGVALYVLTGISNSLLRQATTAHLQATEKNLTASAMTWAQINMPPQTVNIPAEPVELDLTDLHITDANLTVIFDTQLDEKPTVTINTKCTKTQYTFTRSRRYYIPQ